MQGCIAHKRSLFVVVFFLLAQVAQALTVQEKQLVVWETLSNAVAIRSPKPFRLEHYEIPLETVQSDFAANLDPAIKDTLVFVKDGKEYVRWIINPEDTQWHLELKKHLDSVGLDSKAYQYFTGYQTASRSMIVENPEKTVAFSVKVSTNKTGGHWKDKKQPVDDSQQIRIVSDFVEAIKEKVQFQNFIVQDEPLQLGIEAVDQALIVRNLNLPKESKHYYLPGFSAVHDVTGVEIAKRNGSLDPVKFWNDNYNKPLARALAEFGAYFGMAYDSPHSQNFLIELDSSFKPTGRIVLRDFGDAYVASQKLISMGREDLVKAWEQGNVIHKPYLSASVGIMHGNDFPLWLNEEKYKNWGLDFVKEYRKEFAKIMGVSVEQLGPAEVKQNGKYFTHGLNMPESTWNYYLQLAQCFQGKETMADGTPCPESLTKRLLKNIFPQNLNGCQMAFKGLLSP